MGGAGLIIANGAINAATSAISNSMSDYYNSQSQYRAYQYNEAAARNADLRTRALYNDFYSPTALFKQYREAGLSPSLMFGGGAGAGGTTPQGAQGEGASGMQTHTYGINPIDMAQIELMKAQTRKANAEAENEEGTGSLGQSRIALNLANAGAANAAASYDEARKTAQDIANYVAGNTKDFDIFKAKALAYKESAQLNKAVYDALDAKVSYEFDKETYKDRAKIIAEERAKLAAETLYLQSKKKLTEQEILESESKIARMFEQNLIEWAEQHNGEITAESYQTWVNAKIPYIEKELENEAKRLKIENTRIWLDFGADLYKGTTSLFILGNLGKGGLTQPKINPTLGNTKGYNAQTHKEFGQHTRNKKGRLYDYQSIYDE